MKVGFVGLGTMGLPMTRNLIEKGFDVTVISRSRPPVEKALSWGAKEASTYRELAEQVDLVCTCLPMPDTVESVYLGEKGLLEGARPGLILADHSTVSPDLNKKIARAAGEKGVHFLDAPISGGPMGAEAGTLTIMVGGEEEPFQKATPAFEAMGKHIVRVGETGSGSVAKLINNLLVGIHTAALSEAFVMGAKAGITSDVLFDIIRHSTGYNTMMDRCLPLIEDRDFKQRFSVKLLHKDIRLALDMANKLEVDYDFTALAEQKIEETSQDGHADEDISAIVLPYEKKGKVTVGKK
ncbi:MAG: NAD(P)-dependent oxidoreductase [Bacillaceae bacterium]|nr:NAD(P)-dependent oxidoreductase [Bacillaceae bacterium]